MNPPPAPSDHAPSEETLFVSALACAAGEERTLFLDVACRGNPQLRARVDSLLRAHAEARGFMNAPHVDALRPANFDLTIEEKPGDRIGRYKLLQKIGEGGCGVVYMAEQEESVRRRVALKVIKLGMDTKAVIARFEAERQALARMEHPNIARVLDAGATVSGRPYFVMELVRGMKITHYCDQNNLSTDRRLELFIKVCQAIQHAHQKGIIHRDIKPSNILVTLHDGEPVPKVIDFGIAKATQGRLTESTLFTEFEQFMGTPAYVSPEQAEMSGLDIDTRSDIYSLGVLLYELLTGRTPFDTQELTNSGIDEMRRRIREQEPPRPSARLRTLNDSDRTTVALRRSTDVPRLTLRLRGDLDWIVMRCLEKDRSRRYETANAVAMDILRHLENEPVSARPPSTTYVLWKLVRRHRLAFGAGLAIALALAGGFAASTILLLRERDALERARALETRAEQERTRAQAARVEADTTRQAARDEAGRRAQLAATMSGTFRDIGLLVGMGRDEGALQEYLDKTAARKKELVDQPEVEAGIDETLAGVCFTMGDYQRAEDLLGEAINLRRRTQGEDAPEVAQAMNYLGLVFSGQSRWAEAEQCHRDALELLQARFGPANPDVAHTHSALGWVLAQRAKLSEAEAQLRLAIEHQRKYYGRSHPEVAASLIRLGSVLMQDGRVPDAEIAMQEAYEINLATFGENSSQVATALNFLAVTIALDQRRLGEAIALYRRAFEIRRLLNDPARAVRGTVASKAVETAARPPAAPRLTLEAMLTQRDALAEVELALKDARRFSRSQYAKDSWEEAFYLALMGWVLLQEQKYEEAETIVRQCLAVREKLRPDDWSTYHARHMLGAALAGQNHPSAAEPLLVESYYAMKAKLVSIPPFHVPRVGESAQRIIKFYIDLGRKDDAAKWQAEFNSLEPEAKKTLLTNQPAH